MTMLQREAKPIPSTRTYRPIREPAFAEIGVRLLEVFRRIDTARLERTGKVLIAVFGLLGLFLLQRHFVVEDARWVMGRVLLDPIVLVGVFLLSLLSGLLLVLIANVP